MRPAKPVIKRHYKTAESVKASGGYAVHLDGKPAHTPLRKPLIVPNEKLARAIAEEFMAQGERLDPGAMPLLRLAAIALDVAAEKRAELIDDLVGYADTDLLCYQAENDEALAEKQRKEWGAVLEWIASTHGLVFITTAGVIPLAQPQASLAAMRNWLRSLDNWLISIAGIVARYSGSLILARAGIEKNLDAEALTRLCQLDEDHQSERWGSDREKSAKRTEISNEIRQAVLFLDLLG